MAMKIASRVFVKIVQVNQVQLMTKSVDGKGEWTGIQNCVHRRVLAEDDKFLPAETGKEL